MKNFGGPELQKYANIDTEGRRTARAEEIKEFKEFPKDLKNQFTTVIEFDSSSIEQLDERVFSVLLKLEKELGVKFLMAGRDFPLHSTILECRYEGDDSEEKDTLFKNLQKESVTLLDGHITYDYILIGNNNVLLTASHIPDSVIDLRKHLSEEYVEAGLKPLSMENILHCTIARVSELPEEFDSTEYIKRLTDLRHSISKSEHPLTLQVNNVAREQSYDYVTSISQIN